VTELAADGNIALNETTAVLLSTIRRAKSDAQVSMRADVESAIITAPAAQLELVRQVEGDLRAVGRIANVSYVEGDSVSAEVVLGEQPA
jgi:valyl-tRNA synthetase